MLEEPNRAPPTLEYQTPLAKPSIFRVLRFRGCLIISGVYAVLLMLIPLGYPQPLVIATVFGSFALYIRWFMRNRRNARITEEEEEAVWRKYERHKKEMIEVATRIYKNGPMGSWSKREVTAGSYDTFVCGARALVFHADGTGTYNFSNFVGEIVEIETAFLFKPVGMDSRDARAKTSVDSTFEASARDCDGALLIQFRSPEIGGWHKVYYGFEVRRSRKEDFGLFLWFNGKNPFGVEMKDYWPFGEEVAREG